MMVYHRRMHGTNQGGFHRDLYFAPALSVNIASQGNQADVFIAEASVVIR
jgi:hypothetical protein